MKYPTPSPLFDNYEAFQSGIPQVVIDYVQKISVSEPWHDLKMAHAFLSSYLGSADTFNAYRREIERLLQWSWLIAQKRLPELKREDIRRYIEFFQDPPLSWIADRYYNRFIMHQGSRIPNPKWRPFVVRTQKAELRQGIKKTRHDYKPSNATIASLLAGLSTFFAYLLQEEYIGTNPVQLLRQKSQYIQKQQNQKVTRKLSTLQWQYVINTAEAMANENSHYERHLFILSAFYLLGLRISELAETSRYTPKMGDFAPDKSGYWWFTTVSKGNKLRDVAVPDEMLQILKRYRESRGLTPLPHRNEQTPLLHKKKGRGGLGTRQIRNLVQQCFDAAVNALKAWGKYDEAHDLATATVHWLRHTAISMDVTYRPREHVRDDSGHANSMITDRYIDIDRVERYQSAKGKRLKPKTQEE